MKTLLKCTVLFLLITAALKLEAQEIKNFPRVRMLLMETQLAEIKKNINIDNRNMQKFDQIYREYILEVSALNSTYKGLVPLEANLGNMSDPEIEDNFIRQTEKAKRLLIVREKYFYEFKTIMKPGEIIKMYRIEREIVRKVQQELKNRAKNR